MRWLVILCEQKIRLKIFCLGCLCLCATFSTPHSIRYISFLSCFFYFLLSLINKSTNIFSMKFFYLCVFSSFVLFFFSSSFPLLLSLSISLLFPYHLDFVYMSYVSFCCAVSIISRWRNEKSQIKMFLFAASIAATITTTIHFTYYILTTGITTTKLSHY